MDSAKQTAAPGFLVTEGESKKKKNPRKETVKGKKTRGEEHTYFKGVWMRNGLMVFNLVT